LVKKSEPDQPVLSSVHFALKMFCVLQATGVDYTRFGDFVKGIGEEF
jgi:hypothetical protein